LALAFAALASGVTDAVAFAPVPPPPLLLVANAPPVIAKIKAMNATTVVGLIRLRIAENIGSHFS
jgi:hypothetical protein